MGVASIWLANESTVGCILLIYNKLVSVLFWSRSKQKIMFSWICTLCKQISTNLTLYSEQSFKNAFHIRFTVVAK